MLVGQQLQATHEGKKVKENRKQHITLDMHGPQENKAMAVAEPTLYKLWQWDLYMHNLESCSTCILIFWFDGIISNYNF